jgi:hypothetical protein
MARGVRGRSLGQEHLSENALAFFDESREKNLMSCETMKKLFFEGTSKV